MTMADSLKELLHKEWLRIAQSVVKKRGRRLSDLCFAKRTSVGYAFFLTKKVEWEMLHEITVKVSQLFPHLEFSAVAETCSEMFNGDIEETITA